MQARYLWALCAVGLIATIGSFAWQAQAMGWLRVARISTLPADILQPLPGGQAAAPDLVAIRALSPFGQSVQPAQPADNASAEAAPNRATVNYLLRGVMAYETAATSRAFISDGQVTAAYRVGDPLTRGGVLVEVLAMAVVLDFDGDRVRLGFDGIENADPMPEGPQMDLPLAEVSQPAMSPLARLASAVRPGRGSLDLRDGPPPESVDEYVDMWRGRIQRDPAEVMAAIGVENVGTGYRVKPDPDIGVTLAGLRPGDIVTRLNGQNVGNIDKDRQLYDQVAAAGVARLEVERSGETLLMTFSLR